MQDPITKEIVEFVSNYPQTRTVRTCWGEPLVRFAWAQDPLFKQLKKVVRASHALPQDLLPNAQTVIVYFLPFDKGIPRRNRHDYYASREWAVAYVETNRLIIDINHRLAAVLREKGFDSTDLPPTHNFDTQQLMSDWSHKHVAYIAGLGKFGTHHLLITDKGCCGRLGSLITDAQIPATKRPETEYCLAKYNDSCRICVKKCAVDALRGDILDRHKCYDLLLENAEIYKSEGLADVCGKCSSVVPCSFKNPVKTAAQRH